VKIRPLNAGVATHNVASIRVLEKCGFTIVHADGGRPGGDGVEEVLFELPGC
jgi:RimJ/RimL family protein N-acetyltransferase